ncbi:unnamed protein product, partial [Brassica napus]
MIDILKDLLISQCTDPIDSIVTEVYGTTFKDLNDPFFFRRGLFCVQQ